MPPWATDTAAHTAATAPRETGDRARETNPGPPARQPWNALRATTPLSARHLLSAHRETAVDGHPDSATAQVVGRGRGMAPRTTPRRASRGFAVGSPSLRPATRAARL